MATAVMSVAGVVSFNRLVNRLISWIRWNVLRCTTAFSVAMRLTLLQRVPVSGRCCREQLELSGRVQTGFVPILTGPDVLVGLDVPR